MLAGDFSAFASPACNSGRQIALRAPFVNNQVNPALFSKAALTLASKLPTTTDPCGETRFSLPSDRDEGQAVGRVDYQLRTDNTIFGRYMATFDKQPVPLAKSDNILTTTLPGVDNLAQSLTLGDTLVLGTSTVNSLRFAFNRSTVNRFNNDFFGPPELGINAYNYSPTKEMILSVTGGFSISAATATRGIATNNSYQVSDDLTIVRGRHQFGVGANLAYWTSLQKTWARGGGTWDFNGQTTGLGLGDFLLGRVALFEQGDAGGVDLSQWYTGAYAQDTWRATDRVTINAGLRWEPFYGQQISYGAIANFNHDNFLNGVKSTVYRNAPAGFLYPGDQGFPPGQSGFNAQWWNVAPRLGVAWDVNGNGRTSVGPRTGSTTTCRLAKPGSASPPVLLTATAPASPTSGSTIRTRPTRAETRTRSRSAPTRYIRRSAHSARSIRISTRRARSRGTSPSSGRWARTGACRPATWGAIRTGSGASSRRIPGMYLGAGPCVINGVSYPVCTVNGNLNQRRKLFLENPREGQYIANLDALFDVGSQSYRGLKLSFQRRSVSGVSLNGNYTLSRCFGLDWANTGGTAGGYENPDDPDADRGHCDADRTHIANFTAGVQTPEFDSAALRAVASHWRFSGIVNARSGSWLTVATGVSSFNGVGGTAGLRVKQVSDDVYGAKTLTNYLNRAAFALPDAGTFGNHERNSIRGPGFWKIDLAISRLFAFGASQNVEVRLETFNLLNNFNWGNPNTNFSSGNFGRITTSAGDPRIMQFGVKYAF